MLSEESKLWLLAAGEGAELLPGLLAAGAGPGPHPRRLRVQARAHTMFQHTRDRPHTEVPGRSAQGDAWQPAPSTFPFSALALCGDPASSVVSRWLWGLSLSSVLVSSSLFLWLSLRFPRCLWVAPVSDTLCLSDFLTLLPCFVCITPDLSADTVSFSF